MSLSPAETWDRLRQRARQVLPEQTYRTWLEPTDAIAVEGDTLVIGAPDQFSADWNDSKHADLLATFAPVALGHPIKIRFKVHEERVGRVQMDMFVAPPPAPIVAPPVAQQSRMSTPLNPRYTFDQFVIGKSNDVAAAAAQAAAQAPGKVYNPLFIYGETGLGKTHLMQGIAHEQRRRTPSLRIAYVGTEQFTNEFIGAIQTGQMGDFRRRFREIDLLLVDDVQFLKGKESTQEEFFHTFNAIYEAGRQIVLTSDRPPKEIPGLESRLVSRFEWGMVANVDSPDFEHRIAILKKKASLDHLELTIPDEVIEFIAQHVKSSVRELEGSIIKLLAYASLKHRDISVDLAREALRDKLRGATHSDFPDVPPTTITVATIQQVVAREWGVTPDGLRSKTRTKQLTVPRQIAMYLCRELLALQLVEIGNAFGGRDHSTVIHSLERVAVDMGAETGFAERVLKVRTMLETLRTTGQLGS
ncbi:chromosomal replication initiator protein DnaA [Gemmatimonas sp.]|uniref:chromosomal replication initiator protein DnaA n=1 Tax=Gemmatimonas sp. TaxID=1962908 RepID=UPI0025BCD334|nr:chromosomal replication initiator protein DnaA [Gemmatimonas sp.]MCA2983213.1 chromosomal replication initiator protein DnaA [Gemmatimonas sp.]